MTIEEAIIMLLLWASGTVLGLIITGLLADRLVIRRIMQNKDVQDALQLFRDAKDYLRQILENQKAKKHEEK
jgi:uncharacterized membrane-anchored protein YhcB (DUF1043 family)